ncbi:MAG: AbrB/MazE/SpoVT family DNA-binding domain-containing protein [Eggerthellaceae bacterium]|nr:AbrB/MazE/SpoVT family DNA-binding domain-containing protein [Eggerthellaceae bacterium]
MSTAIAQWGNSEAVRIPQPVLRLANLKRGDQVTAEVNERGNIELIPVERAHRRVLPKRGVTFETLFAGYDASRTAPSEQWPTDDMLGAEWDAWQS